MFMFIIEISNVYLRCLPKVTLRQFPLHPSADLIRLVRKKGTKIDNFCGLA